MLHNVLSLFVLDGLGPNSATRLSPDMTQAQEGVSGVVLASHPFHVQQALRRAQAVKTFAPNLPVALITYGPKMAVPDNLFDRVFFLEGDSMSDGSLVLAAMTNSPYERSVLLDANVLPCGSVALVLEYLARHDLAMVGLPRLDAMGLSPSFQPSLIGFNATDKTAAFIAAAASNMALNSADHLTTEIVDLAARQAHASVASLPLEIGLPLSASPSGGHFVVQAPVVAVVAPFAGPKTCQTVNGPASKIADRPRYFDAATNRMVELVPQATTSAA